FNDLVIATYGRGFWILDDLTPLQQSTAQVASADAHLFPTPAAWRFRDVTDTVSMPDDPTVGQNPSYGAAISYYLKSAPAGPVTLSIVDRQGRTIRSLPG